MRRGRGGGAGSSPEGIYRSVRGHLRRRGGLLGLLALGCVAATVLIAAWVVVGGGWRPGSFIPAALVALGVSAGIAALVAVGRFLRRWTEERTLAGEMERQAGLSPGALRAQMELERSAPDGVSPSLIRAGGRGLRARLASAPGELAGRPGHDLARLLRWTAGGMGALALVVVLLLVLAPDRALTAWSGLAHPHRIVAAGVLSPLVLHPGDAHLRRGTVPEIRVSAAGRLETTVHWQGVGEPLREMTLEVVDGVALGELPPLEGPVRYWASAPDGSRTPTGELVPTDPLLLSDLAVELRYPDYTRLPPETRRGPPDELVVPEGTRLTFRGRVDADAATEILIVDERGDPVVHLPTSAAVFEGEWRPVRSRELRWEVEGADGQAALPPPFTVTVVPDRPPTIELPVPGADGELPASFRLPLLLEAADDHGLAWVEVEAIRVRRDGSRAEPVRDRIPAESRRELSLRPVLDLVEWDLRPGEEILLSARAADASPREQTASTREYRLRVPSLARLRESARERIQDAGERVGSMAERARSEAGDLRDRSREATMGAGDRGSEFRSREELREAARAGMEISEELEQLRTELEEARRALQGAGEEDGGLRERLQELASLMSELADPEERARMEELLERLAQGDSADAASELEEMSRARAEMAERLEEALERLRHEALQETFRGSEEELRALAEAQDTMEDRLGNEQGQAEQDSLAARAQTMEERLEELAGRLEGRGDSASAARTRDAGRELEGARERMEAAAEAARSGNEEEASGEARGAAEQTEQALQEMEEARQEWQEAWEEQIRDALRSSAEDALSLSRRQDDLAERMRGAGPEERSAIQGEEAVLGEGIRNLANRLGEATREAPQLGREVGEALGEAMGAVEAAMEGLRRDGPDSAPESAERAIDALNRAALLALEGMDQVGEQGEGGGSGMDDLMQRMEELAEQQESLNQEARSLQAEPDAAGASERMQEMSAGQDAVGQAVEELARRSDGGEWSPGDLDQMAREAREIAQELAGGRLDAQTLERQESLLQRFLGAGRTFEREGPTEEREGTTAGEVERRAVQPLPAGILQGTGLPLPTAEELSRLSPAERRMVLEYFERLNRRPPAEGRP